jgi:phosphoribosylaminoimidazolecarboxamide formyltransferase/IMP cyclohydrolase
VKTLDFKIYLGLLAERFNDAHQDDLVRSKAVHFDIVVANLYPFEKIAAQNGVTVEIARAHIDIGGPCMIRAAAKNYLRVAAIVEPGDYGSLLESLRAHNGRLSMARRFELACKAFTRVAQYDQAIGDFLARVEPEVVPSAYALADEESE